MESERPTLQSRLKRSIHMRRDAACWGFEVEVLRETFFVAELLVHGLCSARHMVSVAALGV